MSGSFVLLIVALAAAPATGFGQGLGPPPPPHPDNPTTPAKVLLGKALYWDEQLSSTGTMACGSCHRPESGGADPRSAAGLSGNVHPGADGQFGTGDDVRGSPGVVRNLASGAYEPAPHFGLAPQVTPRRAPSSVNAAYAQLLFWDGRATGTFRDPETGVKVLPYGAALESQAVEPLASDAEMAHVGQGTATLAARVAAARPLALAAGVPAELDTFLASRSYPEVFQEVFGSAEVDVVRIALAIAAYERTLYSDRAPIDDYLNGDVGALTPEEQRGLQWFNSPVTNCKYCHPAPLYTSQDFEYIGVRPAGEDPGRFAVTGNPDDLGKMRVPGLRNVELRAPFFHNGSQRTLEEVVDFYDRGGDFDAPNKSNFIRPLGMTPVMRAELLAFLRRPLTDPRVAAAQPPFDHPLLYAGSPREPQPLGTPTAGSGGFAPRMVALAPPRLGNPRFTVGMEHGLGGARAWLLLDRAGLPGGQLVRGARLYLAGTRQALLLEAGALAGGGAGGGYGSLVLAVPANPGIRGRMVYGQWLVADPGSTGGLAASAAFAATLF